MSSSKIPSIQNRQAKDNYFQTQLMTLFHYLEINIATASMVCANTSVPHKNFTRYKRDLEKIGRLWEIEKRTCKHTGHKAWYLTTNPQLRPPTSITQLTFKF